MSTMALPTYNARALAVALRERNLPGQRSMTAITLLRRERDKRRIEQVAPIPLRDRLQAWILDRFTAEVSARGGETWIDNTRLHIAERDAGLVLLHAEGWRQYSRREGAHRARLSYLCGHEDGQDWAVRVPGTITTVSEALAWITPAAVKDAQAAGRRVVRQGDLYAIETTRQHDGTGELPDRHTWDAATRTLSHPQHPAVTLNFPVRFVAQRAYEMGRSSNRGSAD